MTWSLLKVAVMVGGLLGAVVVGVVRKFIKSGWITRATEVAAVRAIFKERIAAMVKNEAPPGQSDNCTSGTFVQLWL